MFNVTDCILSACSNIFLPKKKLRQTMLSVSASSTISTEEQLLNYIRQCGNCIATNAKFDRKEALTYVVRSARNGDIRDLDFNSFRFAEGIHGIYVSAYGNESKYTRKEQAQLRIFLRIVLRLPEFQESSTTPRIVFDTRVAELILQRNLSGLTSVVEIEQEEEDDRATLAADAEDEQDFWGEMLYLAYTYQHPRDRCHLRTSMSVVLQRTAMNPSRRNALATKKILQVMVCAIRGFRSPHTKTHANLLHHVILPLHDVEGKISHTAPLLSVFYPAMMECVVEYIHADVNKYTEMVIRQVMRSWPPQSAGNSPKEILMVQEITTILETMMSIVEEVQEKKTCSNPCPSPLKKPERMLLFRRIASCLTSDNSLVCQATLKMWSEPLLLLYFTQHAEEMLDVIATPLLTSSCTHWNRTVKRMAGLVLQKCLNKAPPDVVERTLGSKHSPEQLASLVSTLVGSTNNLATSTSSKSHSNHAPGIQVDVERKTNSTTPTNNEYGHHNSITLAPSLETLSMFDVVFGKVLGVGSFGTVKQVYKIVRGRPRSDWPTYAVKQIDNVHRELAKREESVMMSLSNNGRVQHPGLICLIAPLFESRSSIHLAMEFADGGDLHSQVIYGTKRLEERTVGFMTMEILSGLQWLHEKGYVYSDLKPENVLVAQNQRLKLCDFGAARKIDETERGQALEGTAMYMSPELLRGSGVLTTAADMWSLGCVIHFMHSGRAPAGLGPSLNIDEVACRVVRWAGQEGKKEDQGHVGGDFPSYFSPNLRSFLLRLLCIAPEERMKIEECCCHIFLVDATPSLPTLKEIYTVEPPPLPPMKSRSQSSSDSEGAWAKRSFSLVVAPLPTKFVRGDGESGDRQNIAEADEERHTTWVPDREQRMLLSMSAIAENEPDEESGMSSPRSRSRPRSGLSGVVSGQEKKSSGGPIRSTGRFPPRSHGPRMMMTTRPPMAGPMAGGTRATQLNRHHAKKKKNKLFVKGLDLTAG